MQQMPCYEWRAGSYLFSVLDLVFREGLVVGESRFIRTTIEYLRVNLDSPERGLTLTIGVLLLLANKGKLLFFVFQAAESPNAF